jgi:hypothetical protein
MTQGTSNVGFLAYNTLRRYPINDRASVTSVDGQTLPDGVLADVHLYVPESLASRVVVSSVSVTPHLIGVTFAAAGSSFVPLASVTVPRETPAYKNVQVQPMAAGVAGWVAFGPATSLLGSWRFDTSEINGFYPAELLPRCVTAYGPTGVTSIQQKDRSERLTGRVAVISGQPDQLVIERATVAVEGHGNVRALVFRLNEELGGSDIFSRFLGPCDKSPDAGTCRKPPIFSINDVTPDEDGVLQIQFREIPSENLGSLLAVNVGSEAVYLDFGMGQGQICAFKNETDPREGFTSCDSPCAPPPTYPGPFVGEAP